MANKRIFSKEVSDDSDYIREEKGIESETSIKFKNTINNNTQTNNSVANARRALYLFSQQPSSCSKSLTI
ncbi:MAG: hypothetical protein GY928_03330 [Colwellia sp.]|nr:hypothetical protein [Colwellia sp.]